MGDARPLYKTDECARLAERVARLEARDAERARRLHVVQNELRTAVDQLERETAARLFAERNADQFHALLIQERVRKVKAP